MNWMNFEGPTFTLDAPSNWLIQATQKFQAMFIAKKEEDEVIYPTLTITMTRSEETLADYFVNIGELQAGDYPQYEIVEENCSAEQCQRIYRWKHAASDDLVWQEQRFVQADNGIIYTITSTYLPVQSEHVAEILSRMMDSFSLH